MLNAMVIASLATNIFSLYPGLIRPGFEIQAVTDKGPVLELIVACNPGEGMMSYSKIERLFCLPDAVCYHDLKRAMAKLCQ